MSTQQLVGLVVIVSCLAADVALTLTNHTVPSLVMSVLLAAAGAVFPGLAQRQAP